MDLQREIADIRIGLALPAECRHLAVAGDEMHVVAERPQARGDRIDELLMIAARQIAAPDGTCEQDVTDERVFNSIMNGRNVRGNMPAFSDKLKEQEVDSLVSFVRKFKG